MFYDKSEFFLAILMMMSDVYLTIKPSFMFRLVLKLQKCKYSPLDKINKIFNL